MRSFLKFTTIFAGIGFFVPLLFRVAWYSLNKNTSIHTQITAEKIMLLLWPTSLMTLPSSPEPSIDTKLFLMSLFTNVLFYIIIGALIWLGLRKHIVFFVVACLSVVVVWWRLLTL